MPAVSSNKTPYDECQGENEDRREDGVLDEKPEAERGDD
jgi:hypothetical protein